MRLRVAAAAGVLLLLLPVGCTRQGAAPATSTGASTAASTAASTGASPSAGQTTPTTGDSAATPSTMPPPTPSTASDTAGTATSSAPSTETPTVTTYVYFAVDTRVGLRLARELRDVPSGAGGPAAAVADMIAGAQDPDYTSTWNRATRVLGVRITPDLITVDLSADARTANAGSAGAALMIQQLVWTVTEAARQPQTAVRLAIDGVPAGDLWGAVSWAAPITREEPMSVRTLVQIDQPREGAATTSPVTVSGDAAAFEANVPWRVLAADGTVVASGHTLTSEGQTFAPYSFRIDLAPGSYTVQVLQDDPSGGAAGPPMTDTRRFTVTG